jgi:hypothetical protein
MSFAPLVVWGKELLVNRCPGPDAFTVPVPISSQAIDAYAFEMRF